MTHLGQLALSNKPPTRGAILEKKIAYSTTHYNIIISLSFLCKLIDFYQYIHAYNNSAGE